MSSRPRIILLAGDGARAALHELLADGSLHVRVLTRDETEAAVMKRLRAEVSEGDLTDCPSIRKAMKGAYGVIATPRTIEEGRNLLKVAAGSEIEQIVIASDMPLEEYAGALGTPATFINQEDIVAAASRFVTLEETLC